MLFCNRTLNMLSSPLSIIYTPSLYSSCCNLTLVSESSDQMIINLINFSSINPSLKISNKEFEMIKFNSYISSNQTSFKSDLINLPITFSLCQFNLSSFEILISNASKGNLISDKKLLPKYYPFLLNRIVFKVNTIQSRTNNSRRNCHDDYCFWIITDHWFSNSRTCICLFPTKTYSTKTIYIFSRINKR